MDPTLGCEDSDLGCNAVVRIVPLGSKRVYQVKDLSFPSRLQSHI